MMVNLDQKDLTILYYLKQDSRMSLTDLGKKMDLTPAAITYRLNRLTRENVIKRFSIDVNNDILTPNYSSYCVKANIENNTKALAVIQASGLFENQFIIAASDNFLGITIPFSSKQLIKLSNIFHSLNINRFTIVPIINNLSNHPDQDVVGENINNLYCPQCQKSLHGFALISEIDGQIRGFCCEDCRDEFIEQYDLIKNTMKKIE